MELTRRRLWLTLASVAIWPMAARAAGGDLLDRAIARAGGAAALSRAKVLRWTGTAKIFAGVRVIEIGVSTTVRPWAGARSDSWLLADGPAKTRSLIIEGAEGWTERDGVRSPMPPAMLAHERAQYALYGLMLLTPLRDGGAKLAVDAGRREITVTHADAPTTLLIFDRDGRLAGARNDIPSPDPSGGSLHQDFRFEGEIVSHGVRWPRRLTIDQEGKPYFDLTLTTFEAGPA
jgi:hypothetical protein